MSIPKVKVPITLDKPRTLVMSFNAMCDVQQVVGYNPFAEDAEANLSDPITLRAFLWASLRHEEPTLTLERVGDMLDETPGGFVAALTAVAQAVEASMPELEVVEAGAEAAASKPTGSQ